MVRGARSGDTGPIGRGVDRKGPDERGPDDDEKQDGARHGRSVARESSDEDIGGNPENVG